MCIHQWNEACLPSRTASTPFGLYSFPVPVRVGGWVGLGGCQLVKVTIACQSRSPQPSINRAQRKIALLIETRALPLSHAATSMVKMVLCLCVWSVCLRQWVRLGRHQQWERHRRRRHWSAWWASVDCHEDGTSLVLLAVKRTSTTRLLAHLGEKSIHTMLNCYSLQLIIALLHCITLRSFSHVKTSKFPRRRQQQQQQQLEE